MGAVEPSRRTPGRRKRAVAGAASSEAADRPAHAALTQQAAAAARMLKLLGNEHRLLALCFLAAHGEMTAGELVASVGLSQSALSQHLARLRAEGLISFRRESQTLHYRISDRRAAQILELLKELYCPEIT